jgi:hypothetical protein
LGIFSKKPKEEECDMCGALVLADEKFSHRGSHVMRIGLTEPLWLPENLRVVAQGEYTFRCDRCRCYPDIKWPSEAGAQSGMDVHLAVAHRVRPLGNSGRSLGAAKFGMAPIGGSRDESQ